MWHNSCAPAVDALAYLTRFFYASIQLGLPVTNAEPTEEEKAVARAEEASKAAARVARETRARMARLQGPAFPPR